MSGESRAVKFNAKRTIYVINALSGGDSFTHMNKKTFKVNLIFEPQLTHQIYNKVILIIIKNILLSKSPVCAKRSISYYKVVMWYVLLTIIFLDTK